MSAEIKSMRALLLKTDEPSSLPSLITTTLPIPVPKPTYVLVKVHAAAINPSDVLNASGSFSHTTFPRVPGRDFAGIVASGPPELQGKWVYGTSGRSLSFTEDGAHAEYCAVPSGAVAIMPKNFTFAQAASVGVPWTTAFIVLHRAQTIATETVLVLGATGAVGSAVVQLARAKGCKVITASRRQTTDINILTDQELSKARVLTDGRGVDGVVDTIGNAALMRTALNILAPRGRLSFISASRSGTTELTFDMKQLYRKEQSIVGCNSVSYTSEEMATILRTLTPEFEKGTLTVQPDEDIIKVGLGEEAVAGYSVVRERSGKKLVISMV